MRIEGSVALVTGANRGLGRALARALRDRGAAKVYAGARDTAAVQDDDLIAVELDVTDGPAIARAARLSDVQIVVNNAGIATPGRPLTVPLDAVRRDLEVNYLGPLAIAQAFAPVLAANGGGALVNILSVYSWTTIPPISAYAASKAAAWSVTNALRQQLRAQKTLVVGVYSDSIDTDMTAGLPGRKHDAADVAARAVEAIAEGREELLLDRVTREARAALADPPA